MSGNATAHATSGDYVVHSRYTRCASEGVGGEEDKQGDGEYPQAVQRYADHIRLQHVYSTTSDGNLDGYQKKK